MAYRRVGRRCLELRRAGALPWNRITDLTCTGYHVSASTRRPSTSRRWPSGYRAALWTESRSIAGTPIGECRRLAVSLYPCGGFASATLAWEAARAMNATGCDRAVLLQLPTLVCKSSAKPRLPALGLEPKRFQIAYGAAT